MRLGEAGIAAPVPFSSPHAELERQDHVALGLAQLLATASKCATPEAGAQQHWAPSLAAAAAEPLPELEAWLQELESVRCVVHLADLDNCPSQHRQKAIQFSLAHDEALRAQEQLLLPMATEAEKQHFWNDIHGRIKRKDFSSFAFEEKAFQLAWDAEKATRAAAVAEDNARRAELEALCEPCLKKRLAECGEAVANFPWQSLEGGGAAAPVGTVPWHSRMDSLSMEGSQDLWVAVEGGPKEEAHQKCRAGVAQDLLLLVDLSGSMCDVLHVVKECLRDLLSRVQDVDRVCLVGFSSHPTLLCDWTPLSSQETRSKLCQRVEVMASGGGTNLAPALKMVREQLAARRQLPPLAAGEEGRRSVAVVVLSDGDPEEPAEVLSSSAARTFAGEPSATVVALALGEDSRPDLMALVAQCGCGASLYIAGQPQLPVQLGRMWGLLGREGGSSSASRGESQSSLRAPPALAEVFLVLEPTDGAEVLETERPPGGIATLASSEGRQVVVLRCGRRVLPDLQGNLRRIALRLSLPSWAAAPIDTSALQRPLLRATWVWLEEGETWPRAQSELLRAIQVPDLLTEAKTGLPLRVVLASQQDAEGLDREAFLRALAAALGISPEHLLLARVSKGSIVADLRVLFPLGGAEELQRCSGSSGSLLPAFGGTSVMVGGEFCEVKEASLPGRVASRRMLQWRLAAALEKAAHGNPDAREALLGVQALASDARACVYDACDSAPNSPYCASGGAAAGIERDALSAVAALDTASADGGALSKHVAHTFAQHAHAHCQQLCPETDPEAAAVRCYEGRGTRQAALAFQASAALREHEPPVAVVGPAELQEGSASLAVRLGAAADVETASAVQAFHLEVHCGEEVASHQLLVRAGDAAVGVDATFPALRAGFDHALVARTFTGRSWGPPSEPVMHRPSAAGSSSSPARVLRRGSGRGAGVRKPTLQAPEIDVTEVSATALGTLSLAWEVLPPGAAAQVGSWDVEVVPHSGEGAQRADLRQRVAGGLQVARFFGLAPSAAYRYAVTAVPLEAAAAPATGPSGPPPSRKGTAPAVGGGAMSFQVQGTTLASRPPPLPSAAQGEVVMPPAGVPGPPASQEVEPLEN